MRWGKGDAKNVGNEIGNIPTRVIGVKRRVCRKIEMDITDLTWSFLLFVMRI